MVVGASAGGLAAAGALSRAGWQVTLVEREDRVRPGRTATVLWANGIRALRTLGLGASLDAIATPVPPVGVHRPDGQVLTPATPWPVGLPPVAVTAEALHDALVAGLGNGVEVRTGYAVSGLSGARRPAVTDGRSELVADLVVAADGVDSVLRARVAPEARLRGAGWVAWHAIVPWYRVPDTSAGRPGRPGCDVLGAGYRFVAVPLRAPGGSADGGRVGVYWVATATGAARPEPAGTQLALLRRWFTGWPDPVGALLAATEPADLVQRDVRMLRPLPTHTTVPRGLGGLVLLGDAAHALAHQLGQGTGAAFEDAATLAAVARHAVPGPQLVAALAAYDRLRRPRVAQVVRHTRRMAMVNRAGGPLLSRARDAALGRISARLLSQAADAAAGWRPPT